ncbi:hypothetical protein [Actinoplanes regularis]|uniref:hypothetical protein n=1 Tax=Actinoplanes regularis TaxID=52697 RepID=UPI0024A2E6A1|nr:hypothetical protein [Actinoplanes regularis]GLW32265.1 hypothetical protein Areg01_52040 [Actinoplanes regularis]
MTVIDHPRPAAISLPVGRWLVLLLAMALFAIGWTVRTALWRTSWAAVWVGAAVMEGWAAAGPKVRR